MNEIDEDKISQAEETAREMYEGGTDSLEIVEYLTLALFLTQSEAEILEGTLEGWEQDEDEEEENY